MRQDVRNHLDELGRRLPVLQPMLGDLADAWRLLVACFDQGGRLMLCGNGGSAADCEHIAGELLKGFNLKRPVPGQDKETILLRYAAGRAADAAARSDLEAALERLQLGLPAIPLVSQAALGSAVANDLGADLVYAQQVMALGCPGDLLLGISTSGHAQNVLQAVRLARGLGLTTIGLTGADGGQLARETDLCLRVPASRTPDVQELHLPVYHTLCAMLEQHYFGLDA
jgi:D-sedoheptulose 7-phosphate isomerase